VTGRRLIVEADGGSRGNPGPAGFGTVVRDADTGEVLAERAESLGTTTNNVAEYRGLIAGLRAAAELTPSAVDVRMDSKLVVEQMSGRWKVKHPDLQALAREAVSIVRELPAVTFGWVPRELNRHADQLANEAMDGNPSFFAGSKPAASTVDDRPESLSTVLVLMCGGPAARTDDGWGDADPTDDLRSIAVTVRRARDRLLRSHSGERVIVAAHARPIATAIVLALEASPESATRLQIDVGSSSTVDWSADGVACVRSVNVPGR